MHTVTLEAPAAYAARKMIEDPLIFETRQILFRVVWEYQYAMLGVEVTRALNEAIRGLEASNG